MTTAGYYKNKFLAAVRNGPLYVLRRFKDICTPRKRALEVFFTETRPGSVFPEDKARELKNKFCLCILTNEQREYYDQFVTFCKGIPLSREWVDSYLAGGCRIFLLLNGDEIIGVTALDFGSHKMKGICEIEMIFARNHAYSFLVYVHPDHRRKGVATLLSYVVREYCMSQGYDGYFSLIDDWNVPSLGYHSKRGNLHYGRIVAIEQFRARRYKFRSFNKDRSWQIRLNNGKLVKL